MDVVVNIIVNVCGSGQCNRRKYGSNIIQKFG